MKISGIYSGFFPDKSLGVTFGLRLPTGDFKETSPGIDIDRDSQVGYGSTDLLLGAYFTHALTSDDAWSFFVQSSLDLPVWTQDGYRPGVEASEAIGIYYNNWSVGEIMIQPIAQVIATHRSHDRGPNAADPVASGSDRIFLAPGVLIQRDAAMVQAVVELPVYNYVSGNQLVGNTLLKVMFGYRF
jgi:hypothetical protein